MPSKRTNDSVDRILQELGREQNAAQVRGSVTDQQIDEILRGVTGAAPAPRGSAPQGGFAFAELDDELELMDDALQRRAPAAPPRPTAQLRHSAASAPPVKPVRTERETTHRPMRPVAPERQAAVLADTGTLNDTTRTGIIKGFLVKMAPGSDGVDTNALNEGKDQFQKFFKESVAVIPDENGRIREPGRKKRGIFGLKSAEDTGEFVPINVSLGAARDDREEEYDEVEEPQRQPEPAPKPAPAPRQEEYFPDRPVRPAAQDAPARPAKKRGLFGGLFGAPKTKNEDIFIPEPRAEPAPRRPEPSLEVSEPTMESERAPRRSKYTRPAPAPAQVGGNTLSGDTLQALRSTVSASAGAAVGTAASASVGGTTIYRKKRNTVEFVPGQKPAAPPPAPPRPAGEPVGEPVEAPVSGFTMQMNALDVLPVDSTQDFMQAYNAVRRPARSARPPVPAQPATARPAPPPAPENRGYSQREPDEIDRLVDTLTGKISLNPAAPQPTQNAAPAPTTAHSGFTMQLGGAEAAPAPAAAPPAPPVRRERPPITAPRPNSFVDNIAEAINTGDTREIGTIGAFGDATGGVPLRPEQEYDEAADRLTATLAEEAAAQSPQERFKQRVGLRLGNLRTGGRPDDEEGEGQNGANAAPFDTAELPAAARREYNTAADAPAVRRELETNLLRRRLEVVVGAVAALVVLAISVAAMLTPALPAPLTDKTVLLAVVLVLLVVGLAANGRTVLNGFAGFAGVPAPDSLALLPALGAVVQLVVLLAMPTAYDPATLPLLAGPALLALCMNAVGQLLHDRAVQGGFALVSANVDHAVSYRLKDAGALNAVSSGLTQPHASVLVSRPTQIFKNFLSASAAHGTSDKNQQQFAWLVGACGLLGLVFSLVTTRNAAMAATVLACVMALGAPLAGTLISALPARLMQRSAAQVGAVVPGWRDIRQLGRINVVQVSSRDLFPAGCVSLCGIKPVRPEHIDLAIVYAASILAEAAPPLRDVFVTMLGQNKNLVAKVADRETIYGKGYIGWINKRRVMVGSRTLMLEHGIKIPGLEYEQQHTVNQRRVIYLAVSGKLFAMFQIGYQSDADTAAVLDSLRHSGVSLIVDAEDFNCDAALLETAYSMPTGSVKVLTARERAALEPHTAWLPESEGNMLHLGSFASFVGGLEAAAGAAEGERKAGMVLSAGVLFSCALAVLLTLTGGLTGLPLPAIVLYQAVWAVIALIFPLIQRY